MKDSTQQYSRYYEVAGALILVTLWSFASFIEGSALLPGPPAVLKEFWHIITVPENLWSALVSLGRGFFGIGAAVVAGILMGFIAGKKQVFESLLRPLVSLLKATPVVSIIILFIFWFNDKVPLVIGFIIAFPVVYHGVLQGTRETDIKLLELAKVYKVPRKRVLTSVYFPSVLPYLVASLDTAVGIGWKSVIAAEVICQPRTGIGTQLMNAKYNLVTESLLAWTMLAVLVSYCAELLLRRAYSKLGRWKP